jgi:hypothetical protein
MRIIARILTALAAGTLTQTIVKRLLLLCSRIVPVSFGFLVEIGCLERPAHAYCMWHAARLAQRLGYTEISVAEFGVAYGATLLIVEQYAKRIEKAIGVRIKVYGFDTGAGLPTVEGVRDLPYWFRPSQYAMRVQNLRDKLGSAELILGNVRDTVQKFFEEEERPPLGAIFNDLDFFSSSRDALEIFNADSDHFLPRMFMYLDDVCGSPMEMYGRYNGELAANEMFNGDHESIKIDLNQNLLPQSHLRWRYQIYYIHLFNHAKYSEYIGNGAQSAIERGLQQLGR